MQRPCTFETRYVGPRNLPPFYGNDYVACLRPFLQMYRASYLRVFNIGFIQAAVQQKDSDTIQRRGFDLHVHGIVERKV